MTTTPRRTGRERLLGALAGLPGATIHPHMPPAPSAGDCWPVWKETTYTAQALAESQWDVVWLLPPIDPGEHVDDAALALVLALTRVAGAPVARPAGVQLGPDQGTHPAVTVTVTVDEEIR